MKNIYSPRRIPVYLLCMLVTLIFAGCSSNDDPPVIPPPVYDMNELYARAIQDAMVADSSKASDALWPIKAGTPDVQFKTINGQSYVLMATFMRFPGSYPEKDSITNVWGESWLFIPQQMKGRIGPGFTPASDTILRISQLLGLPPVNSKSNTHIAQIWVKVDSLYRPAGNPAIDTKSAGPVLVPGVTANYANWFNNYIIFAYYRPLGKTDYHYPWTRMGYTYDWAPNASRVGLSEYVVKPNSGMWVEKVTTASGFFK
ncbi:hypothetical protein [Chitinophaga nivalis]|uniref:Lipoprotein n=1 Tax=Chitinophaga nivalis TaxID=2991709 RepID=A0ABT3IRT8_9BACT|nr:hypothetical protein [Chitinophaga nivalis]MCW3463881.1 hypothetical protein [Chitinophaga nivalis]MCW3486429.1 hypothetical protein [Chitinophaga nivalis]